jgi:hypothetical protein
MVLLEISFEIKVTIVTAIFAGIALIISFWSVIVAKKALNLSQNQYNDKLPDFELYFIQGFRFLTKDKDLNFRKFNKTLKMNKKAA